MSPLAGWCLCLIVSCTSGAVVDGSCTGDNCAAAAADSTMLLQSGVGVAVAAHSDPMAPEEVPNDKGGSGSGDSELDCSSFTRGSTCKKNGCAWSGAFVGEKKTDGSELTGYICADDEEVEEEVHDKLMNGTGSLIQVLDDESEVTICAGGGCPYCRRRRRGRSGGCPYCRRRRSPPPAPAKIEANGCPTGLQVKTNGKCPGSGTCCATGWSAGCNQGCVQQRCSSTGGSWIPLNYASNPYTCEMPKPPAGTDKVGAGIAGPTEIWNVGGAKGKGVRACHEAVMADSRCAKDYFTYVTRGDKNCGCKGSAGSLTVRKDGNGDYFKITSQASKYCDAPNADNAGFDCLCAAGTGFCGATNTWHGNYDAAKRKCDGNSECMYLHDWKADGNNWRACRTITSPGDGKAAIKKRGKDGKCPTLFGRIDIDNSDIISEEEFKKAFDAGKISGPQAVTPNPAPPTPAPPTPAPPTPAPPTPAPPIQQTTPAPSVAAAPMFDRIDVDNDKAINPAELKNAIDTGKVTVIAAK